MPSGLQPTLASALLTLRPLRPDDFDAPYALAKDPLVWPQHPVRDRHGKEVFSSFFREVFESGGALIATDTKAHGVKGSSPYHGDDELASEVEIGWTFPARSHRGGAYNREMKRLMLDHASSFVWRVLLVVGPQNQSSQRAAEKIGGRRVRTRMGADGSLNVVFGITRQSPATGSEA